MSAEILCRDEPVEFSYNAQQTSYMRRAYRWGICHPEALKPDFSNVEHGAQMRQLHESLLARGFANTPWQLIFDDQIAGVVGSIDDRREYHVRFYSTGHIDCEAEYGRFDSAHWNGKRADGSTFLQDHIRKTFKEAEAVVTTLLDLVRTVEERDNQVLSPIDVGIDSSARRALGLVTTGTSLGILAANLADDSVRGWIYALLAVLHVGAVTTISTRALKLRDSIHRALHSITNR